MPKAKAHCVNDREIEVLKSFGCVVEDYSTYDEKGSKVRDLIIYYHGAIVGFEDSTYNEVTNNILQVF